MASHIARRKFLATLGGAAAAWPLAASAQQRERMRRIGILWSSPPSAYVERLQAFRQGLRDAGYVEGRDLVLEQRGAVRLQELMPLVAELIESKVDVIVTAGTSPTRAAKAAAGNLPIVMTFVSDPVGSGFIDSLARPGGNITGLTNLGPELSAKWIELLKELVPGASRIGVLYTSPVRIVVQQMRRAAASAAVQLVPFEANSDDAIEQGLSILRNGQPAGLVVILPPRSQVKTIVDFTLTNRLPTIYWWREYVQAGGLAYYGPNVQEMYRRAAAFVDRILKGATPAGLPVEQPTRFDLVINLTTAKALGLDVPPTLLARADEVIE
jgi:putative tryptophan/tyrosine transport system substrate-binding protein